MEVNDTKVWGQFYLRPVIESLLSPLNCQTLLRLLLVNDNMEMYWPGLGFL